MTTERDIELSQRALLLAARGIGLVSPNPLVGCVIVDKSGDIIGEGTYQYDKIVHAEAIALEQAGTRARGGTAYVSLEPHSHQGKTPPCTEALINAGITRVVSPIEDPNPLVSGRGFERLREAGVEVITGILADQASRQNEQFVCWHKKQRPFVHLKLAMSLDARISTAKNVASQLSGEEAMRRVHDLRHKYDAILIGGNTAAIDDPNLTDRSGKARRRPFVRVVLDDRLQISLGSKLVTTATESPTVVFTNSKDTEKRAALQQREVDIVETEKGDLAAVVSTLKERAIQSVLVEGGGKIAGAFIRAGLVDKLTFIYSPLIVGDNDAPAAVVGNDRHLKLTDVQTSQLGQDVEITGYPDGSS